MLAPPQNKMKNWINFGVCQINHYSQAASFEAWLELTQRMHKSSVLVCLLYSDPSSSVPTNKAKAKAAPNPSLCGATLPFFNILIPRVVFLFTGLAMLTYSSLAIQYVALVPLIALDGCGPFEPSAQNEGPNDGRRIDALQQ